MKPVSTGQFYAHWVYRVFLILGAFIAPTLLSFGLWTGLSGWSETRSAVFLVGHLLVTPYMMWMGYHVWRFPMVRITETNLEFRSVDSLKTRTLPTAEITGSHWSDSFFLQIHTTNGRDWPAHLGQLSSHDRNAIAALCENASV